MKVLIFGATGMVGESVLKLCVDDSRIDSIVAVSRRTAGVESAKLKEILISDFTDLSSLEEEMEDAKACFYCVGAYQSKISNKEYWHITVDYVKALVELLERLNPQIIFSLFSADGADPSGNSNSHAARAKGAAENVLTESSLRRKYIFRPGYVSAGWGNMTSSVLNMICEPIYRLFPSLGVDREDLAKVVIDLAVNETEQVLYSTKDIRAEFKK